jgi:hypothetical protein
MSSVKRLWNLGKGAVSNALKSSGGDPAADAEIAAALQGGQPVKSTPETQARAEARLAALQAASEAGERSDVKPAKKTFDGPDVDDEEEDDVPRRGKRTL